MIDVLGLIHHATKRFSGLFCVGPALPDIAALKIDIAAELSQKMKIFKRPRPPGLWIPQDVRQSRDLQRN